MHDSSPNTLTISLEEAGTFVFDLSGLLCVCIVAVCKYLACWRWNDSEASGVLNIKGRFASLTTVG
eukprot:3908651-Amphidinium_carterae.1